MTIGYRLSTCQVFFAPPKILIAMIVGGGQFVLPICKERAKSAKQWGPTGQSCKMSQESGWQNFAGYWGLQKTLPILQRTREKCKTMGFNRPEMQNVTNLKNVSVPFLPIFGNVCTVQVHVKFGLQKPRFYETIKIRS